MNPMEIISLVISILVLVKLLLFIVKPKILSDVGTKMSKNNKVITWSILAAIVVVGYYVLSSLTVVQVLPAIMLGHMILALSLFQYPKMYNAFIKEVFKDTSKTWLVWLIWAGLSLWALYTLFM